jgi:predicted Holliday junction resolvase-like endonuclease
LVLSHKCTYICNMKNLKCECPNCQTEMAVGDNVIDCSKPKTVEYYQKKMAEIEKRKQYLKTAKDKLYQSIYVSTKSINIGFIAERLCPALDSFRFNHNDCRSTGGDPIDYIVFEGLSTGGEVDFIHFVDVKTGGATLSKRQQEIKKVIKDRNVKFRTF